MKRYIAAVLAAIISSGCSGTVTKSFKVFADPPDADIRVVSGEDLKELKYRSPAAVTAEVPKDSALASRAVVEVSKDSYKPFTLALRNIRDGQTLNVRLEKIVQSMYRYRLAYRLVAPAASEMLQFRDATIAVSFTVDGRSIQMRLTNLLDKNLKLLWEQAQYTDVNKQTSRLMHSGVRFQDRNNPIPEQIVPPRASIQEGVIPINRIVFSQEKKAYETKALLPVESEAGAQLKGKTINLFIPIEVDRAIIPYNFKIEITDSVREDVKG
ncbi:MAG TPA: hypothetical protein VLG39_05760 [Nitrospirota bacterium]|nr:hypothetical protein [Nitrospirota bacterium]